MNAITFRLHLVEPVLVSQTESGEENSAIGLSQIPGSALRGALVSRYLRATPLSDPSKDDTFRQLFLDGTVCYLNAYPAGDDTRLLPTPMSWFVEKDSANEPDATIYDWALDSSIRLGQPKAPVGDFCLVAKSSVKLRTPAREINVHIALEDVNVRSEGNKVFRYDALAAGQTFSGAILAADGVDMSVLEQLLGQSDLLLGGSHLVGYGHCRIDEVTIDPYWEECPTGGAGGPEVVVVTALSDIIVRDKNGQISDNLTSAIERILGVPTGTLKRERFFSRLRPVAGFNRKWSLPLVQTWAVEAGSVFVYRSDTMDAAKLLGATRYGIGERRVEGFGRLAVNWQTQKILRRREWPKEFGLPIVLSETSRVLAQQMANRRLRLVLDRRLAEAVSGTHLSHLPQNAQLSRVRSATQRAQQVGDLSLILSHLRDLKGAKDQFSRARVGDTTPMLKWIEERAISQDVSTYLLRSDALPEVAGVSALLTDDLKIEYTARLIESVMKKAAKQNQQPEEVI